MEQTLFDTLLADTDKINEKQRFDKTVSHLPDTMDGAITFHRQQIAKHHQAMLDCEFDKAVAIREEARLLALKLNNNKSGIIAHENAPGCVLARKCASKHGTFPLWGQDGKFRIIVRGVSCAVSMNGIFGIGATSMMYAGFSVKAVDWARPFISETGYRSFLGCSVMPQEGMTPKDFVGMVIADYIDTELKGKLVAISARFHPDNR
ncbi:MAG: hypothetical protein JJ891_16110 [Rhizobiaceae bacterium]|jgi:hypothetical protein|nr:hypothetical protein [Rhizobiaceae bacterium]